MVLRWLDQNASRFKMASLLIKIMIIDKLTRNQLIHGYFTHLELCVSRLAGYSDGFNINVRPVIKILVHRFNVKRGVDNTIRILKKRRNH